MITWELFLWMKWIKIDNTMNSCLLNLHAGTHEQVLFVSTHMLFSLLLCSKSLHYVLQCYSIINISKMFLTFFCMYIAVYCTLTVLNAAWQNQTWDYTNVVSLMYGKQRSTSSVDSSWICCIKDLIIYINLIVHNWLSTI